MKDSRVEDVLQISDLEIAQIAKRTHAYCDDFWQCYRQKSEVHDSQKSQQSAIATN